MRKLMLGILVSVIAGFYLYSHQDKVKSIIGMRNKDLTIPSRQEAKHYYSELEKEIEEFKRKSKHDKETFSKLTQEFHKLQETLSKQNWSDEEQAMFSKRASEIDSLLRLSPYYSER